MGVRTEPHTTCARKLKPGQVKRVTLAGPLIGYHIACPGCRFVASYLKEEAGFLEERDDAGPVLLGLGRRVTCIRCRREITMRAGRLEVA